MKPKFLLLISFFVLGSLIAKANTDPGKKDDIMGSVIGAEGKKAIEGCLHHSLPLFQKGESCNYRWNRRLFF